MAIVIGMLIGSVFGFFLGVWFYSWGDEHEGEVFGIWPPGQWGWSNR